MKNEVYQHQMSLLLSVTSIKPSQMINGNNYTKKSVYCLRYSELEIFDIIQFVIKLQF